MVQAAIGENGRSVEVGLLDQIGRLNRSLAPGAIGPVGAVIGPRCADVGLDLADVNALYLAPGVGAQGATPEEVAATFASCPRRVMPSASRSLLDAGPDLLHLRDGLAELCAEFRQLLGA